MSHRNTIWHLLGVLTLVLLVGEPHHADHSALESMREGFRVLLMRRVQPPASIDGRAR